MKVNYFAILYFTSLIMVCSCETPKIAQKPVEEKPEFVVLDDLIINMLDSVDASELRYDGTGSGTFGRKIIYRDMSAIKSATTISGRVGVKVCINREGIVKYSEVLQDSTTTIKDKNILKSYLRQSMGYKFQPDYEVPKYQCGKMAFTMDYKKH